MCFEWSSSELAEYALRTLQDGSWQLALCPVHRVARASLGCVNSNMLRVFFNRGVENLDTQYRVAQKSKPLPTDQKIVLNRIKAFRDIRFIRQITVWIKDNNIIRWYWIFYAWPTFWP